MTYITFKDIQELKTQKLVDIYNSYSDNPIKKFSDRETAERRTWKIIDDIQKSIKKSDAEKSKVTSDTNKDESKRAEYNSRIIELLIKENPKRANSRAFEKFAIMMAMNGKTIGEFRAEEGNHPNLDIEAGWPSTEIRWAIKLNLIKAPVRQNNIQNVKAA